MLIATFKPTNYQLQMNDQYFVQVQYYEKSSDGFDVCEVAGVFARISDAREFAQWRLASDRAAIAKAVHVFTRDAQIEMFRRQQVPA
jgi:hypothetical protein